MTKLLFRVFFLSLALMSFLSAQGKDPASLPHPSFEVGSDVDHNLFPDDWFRTKGEDYQNFHAITLEPTGADDRGGSLKFLFLGGKVGIYSRPLVFDTRFAYRLSFSYRGKNVDGAEFSHEIQLGLLAFDEKGQQLNIPNYEPLKVQDFKDEWTRSGILDIERLPAKAAYCKITIDFSGSPAGESELYLDAFVISQSPRVRVETLYPLNVVPADKALGFTQWVDGTQAGHGYELATYVRDFTRRVVLEDHYSFTGSVETRIRQFSLQGKEEDRPGVFYIESKLYLDGELEIQSERIVAKNSAEAELQLSEDVGVVVGYPAPQYFDDLLTSLRLLGVKSSKLDLFPEKYSFKDLSQDPPLPDLHLLLRERAPDKGFRFIAVLNTLPEETFRLARFEVNPATHVVQSLAPFEDKWKKILNDILFAYGFVIEHWQVGPDNLEPDPKDLAEAGNVFKYLKARGPWADVFIPVAPDFSHPPIEGLRDIIFLPASLDWAELGPSLGPHSASPVTVTLELKNNQLFSQLEIAQDLVKKLTLLKSLQTTDGQAEVKQIFIDSLTGETSGLMTADYKPHSTYFALKTLARHFEGAKFLGRFTYKDKDIVNFVFEREGKAFALFWSDAGTRPLELYLSENLEHMDLMGNIVPLKVKDHKVVVEVGATPFFIRSPNLELIKTILSYQLVGAPFEAQVDMQQRSVQISNFFPVRAQGGRRFLPKFDFSVNYPSDWEIRDNVFSLQLDQDQSDSHTLNLAPSSISPTGDVDVYTDLHIVSRGIDHQVQIYRRDQLASDVTSVLQFFKEGNEDLQINIQLSLSAQAKGKRTSFVASLLLPDGTSAQALFPDIAAGETRTETLFMRKGQLYIGKELGLELKENRGLRYINRRYSINSENF